METAVRQAARTLGLPELVLHNFMSLLQSVEAPRSVRAVSRPPARKRVDKTALLNALIEEYNTKL